MSFSIVGKTAIVTGAANGVGLAIARHFVQNGANVILADMNEEKLKEYMQWDSILIEVDLKQGNEQFECYTCDFTHDYIDINADYRN